MFAFDKGQGLSEHITSYEALIYVLEDEAEITVAMSYIKFGRVK
ncbi:MAG: hypothetical protein ABI543_12895 [Ignavibacteria bacterium]